VLLFGFGVIDKATRPLFVTFAVGFALFILLPVLASFRQPIIVGRYWLVGAPALIPLMTMAARRWYLTGSQELNERMRHVAVGGVLLFFCLSSIFGFVRADSNVASKPIWRGADIVRPLLDHCPANSVHVAGGDIRAPSDAPRQNRWYFSKAAGASQDIFIEARLRTTPSIAPGASSCPVLAWAEHVMGADFMSRATDSDLIRLMKVDAAAGDVDIRRWTSGFVVLKRGL
jgi:hypothetical protein